MNAACKEEGSIPDRPMLAEGGKTYWLMLDGIPDTNVPNLPRS